MKETFPLSNIHLHQMEFMRDFEEQEGIAFFLIYFTEADVYYYLSFQEALYFWNRMEKGGRKSFRMDELKENFFFHFQPTYPVPYLNMIQKDLDQRNVDSM